MRQPAPARLQALTGTSCNGGRASGVGFAGEEAFAQGGFAGAEGEPGEGGAEGEAGEGDQIGSHENVIKVCDWPRVALTVLGGERV